MNRSQPQRPKEKRRKQNNAPEYDLGGQLDWDNQPSQNMYNNMDQSYERRPNKSNQSNNGRSNLNQPAFPQNDGGGLLDIDFSGGSQAHSNTRNQNQFQTYQMSNFDQPEYNGFQDPPKRKKNKHPEFAQNALQTPQKLGGGMQSDFIGSLNEFQDDQLLNSPFGLGNTEVKPK